MKGARIGQQSIIGQNVNIDGGTLIGNNVKIQNNVSVYTGAVIEDDVFLGLSCVLTNISNPVLQREPALTLRNHSSETRLYDRCECNYCVRRDGRTICVCGRGCGCYQERAGLCLDGGQPGATSGMDEPQRTPVEDCRMKAA